MPDDGPLTAPPTPSGSAPVGDPAGVPRSMPGSVLAGERFGRDRRVHSPRDFARVRREGRAVSGGRLTLAYVAHAIPVASVATQAAAEALTDPAQGLAQPDGPARVGFIVGKRVGGAVVRNRVRRRLREIMRHRLRFVLPGWDLVLIARPPAAQATSADLAHDVAVLLRRARLLIPGYDGAE